MKFFSKRRRHKSLNDLVVKLGETNNNASSESSSDENLNNKKVQQDYVDSLYSDKDCMVYKRENILKPSKNCSDFEDDLIQEYEDERNQTSGVKTIEEEEDDSDNDSEDNLYVFVDEK